MVQAGYDYSRWEETYAPEPAREERRQSRKALTNRNARRNMMIKLSVIVFAYALLLVYLCIKSATLGYEIVGLENEINKLNTENNRMEYAIAQNSSLDIIEEKAITQLGMIIPGTEMCYAVAAADEPVTPALKVESVDNTIAESKPLAKLYASIMLLTGKNNL